MPPPAPSLTDTARGSPSPVNTTMPVPTPSAPAPVAGSGSAPTAPVTAGSGSTGGTPTPDEVLSIVSQFPATYEGARAADAELQRRFGANAPKLLDHPSKLDKWQFPNGAVYDLMTGAGAPGASWVSRATPEVIGGHGAPAGGAPMGSFSGGGTIPSNWQAGMDPSYGFRFGEGLKALERSAAAKGTLLGGGQLKALTRYGQGMASTEFQNIFDRNKDLASLGLNAVNNSANLGSSYSGQLGNLASNTGNQFGSLAGNQSNDLGNTSSGYIGNLVNLLTGQGNVNASGAIGGANAWRGTLGDLANIFGPALVRQNG